jgi:hypothetical protein
MAGRFFGLVLLGLIMAPSIAAQQSLPGDAKLQEFRMLDLDGAFAAVATTIRFEPYAGILRGSRGTVLARGGNAADQVVLLADLLRANGYRVRFVRGTLAGANLDALVRSMYPPDVPAFALKEEYLPYDPASDAALRRLLSHHVWLEVDQGGENWLPLDPSFPRARIGEAYAAAKERLDDLPGDMYQRIVLTVHEETSDGAKRELGSLEGTAAELGLRPLSLLVLGVRQLETPEEGKAKGGSAGGLFGGVLSGGKKNEDNAAESPNAPRPAGMVYRRTLLAGQDTTQLAPSLVRDDDPASRVRREWLKLVIHVPGRDPRTVVRDLYINDAPGVDGAAPTPYRRYTLAVLTGPIEPEAVRDHANRLRERVDLGASKVRIEAIGNNADEEAASVAVAVDGEIGPLAGHLAGMAFAAESDALARRIAFSNGVIFAQAVPRIVITSVEGEAGAAWRVALDLRLDEVEAWPYPGYASRAAEHFQSARGIQNTMLESDFLERILGFEQTANTANLVAAVEGVQGAMLLLVAGQEDQLDRIDGMSPYVRRLIAHSLESGREVIIPPEPLQLAGRMRLGWWERDPATGRVVGVMDDGLHQAMTSYSVSTTEISLDDDMGFVVGMIIGATGTQFLVAAKILEYGEVTDQLIADVEARVKMLKCLSCPKAEASVSAGASFGDSCYKVEKKIEAGVSVSAGSFCEKYVAGMACASSMILNGLKGGSGGPSGSVEGGVNVEAGCQ